MKSITSVLSIIALGVGLLSCSGGDGGGGGGTSAFAVSTTSANFGVVDNPYTSTLAATGGTAPFTWMQFGGVLPTGLLLHPGTGVVSGTPGAPAGNFNATFTVTDSTGQTATGSVLFAIHPRTDRVSVNSSGTAGDGASSAPSISGDGSLVAFVSQSANFVATVGGTQIYVHNRQTNQIELISRDSNATTLNEGGGVSSAPAISADGRFVAFVSQSTNLVAGVIVAPQIYLRDRQTGQTTLVSQNSSGVTSNGLINSSPAVSENGQFIAFVSNATNLASTITGKKQIYIRDRVFGTTSLISKDNNLIPAEGDGDSSTPSISTCFTVAFASASTNLGAPANQILVRGPFTVAGCAGIKTTLVSQNSSGVTSNGLINSSPAVSENGQFIAFVSNATNLASTITGKKQIYIRDRVFGTTSLISKDNNLIPAEGDGDSSTPSISTDGCFVAFASASTNLGAPANQILVRGPLTVASCAGTEQTSLVSKNDSGNPANGAAGSTVDSSVSGSGQFIAFSSSATNLVTAPPTAPSDIYVRAMP